MITLPAHLDIYSYKDYTLFLKDFYEARKKEVPHYSYVRFAADLGFSASNYLFLVIKRKRHLADEAIAKINGAVEWDARQKSYFEALVRENRAEDAEEKQKWLNARQKILLEKESKLSPDQFAFFTTWTIPVIREIITMKGAVSNLKWIAKKMRPAIKEEQVRKAVEILERLGLLKSEGGKWVKTEKHLTTDAEVVSNVVLAYHEALLELSLRALKYPAKDRDISAVTMSLAKDEYEEIKKKVAAFRNEIQHLVASMKGDPQIVVQLNMQLFPVTEE